MGATMLVQLAFAGCGTHARVDSPDQPTQGLPLAVPLGLDLVTPVPVENPLTRGKVELGRRLFFDPLLSLDRSLSCASCHRPEVAFADTLSVSPGVQGRRGTRNSPTLANRAYGRSFFWDGRAVSLEAAVLLPVKDPNELALPLAELEARLRGDGRYRTLFRRAFNDAAISSQAVSQALASYLRTLRSGDAPVDRFLAGDSTALDERSRRGRALFLGKAGCARCHSGPTFTDERFHNTGVSSGNGDPGRADVTQLERDRGRFKTPTLRNVALTAPYMHDGSIATLEEVLEFYDRGGGMNPNLDPDVRPLNLTGAERDALVAFLRALGSADHR